MPEAPWLVRPYDPALDANGIVYLFLKSFAHSPHGRERSAHLDGSQGERSYWEEHRQTVMHLLDTASTVVLCDPEAPGVIWAFAITSPNVVHYALVKRRFKDLAPDMFAALLGDFTDTDANFTHDFSGTGFKPPSRWRYNPYLVRST